MGIDVLRDAKMWEWKDLWMWGTYHASVNVICFESCSTFWWSSEHPVSYFISHKIKRSQGSYFYFARMQIIAKDIRRLAANSARKQLFTCVIYTNVQWFLHLTNVSRPSLLISSTLPVSRFLSVTSPPNLDEVNCCNMISPERWKVIVVLLCKLF